MEKTLRIGLILLAGSFPLAVYQFSLVRAGGVTDKAPPVVSTSNGSASSRRDIMEMNTRVDAKAREIQEIDVKILQNRGTILQLEEDRSKAIKDLEDFQTRLSNVLRDIRNEPRLDTKSGR